MPLWARCSTTAARGLAPCCSSLLPRAAAHSRSPVPVDPHLAPLLGALGRAPLALPNAPNTRGFGFAARVRQGLGASGLSSWVSAVFGGARGSTLVSGPLVSRLPALNQLWSALAAARQRHASASLGCQRQHRPSSTSSLGPAGLGFVCPVSPFFRLLAAHSPQPLSFPVQQRPSGKLCVRSHRQSAVLARASRKPLHARYPWRFQR